MFLNIYQNKIKWGVASIQLAVRYPQLLAALTGQIETLIWRIFA